MVTIMAALTILIFYFVFASKGPMPARNVKPRTIVSGEWLSPVELQNVYCSSTNMVIIDNRPQLAILVTNANSFSIDDIVIDLFLFSEKQTVRTNRIVEMGALGAHSSTNLNFEFEQEGKGMQTSDLELRLDFYRLKKEGE